MRFGLEVIVLPVADIDRAKAFYEQVGFNCDVDHHTEEIRVVQFTPPGSECSISFGRGVGPTTASPVMGLHLIVSDLDAAVKALRDRGIEVEDPFHYGATGRVAGVDPAHNDFASYSEFRDPDGNAWVLQEVPSRGS